MEELGLNYRLSDLQCALGISQLAKANEWVQKRRAIAVRYDAMFSEIPEIRPLAPLAEVDHAYHLYVIELTKTAPLVRDQLFTQLRSKGIGVNVHYYPVHLQPYYQKNFGTKLGDCPVAENIHSRILSLPMFPTLKEEDQRDVVRAIEDVFATEGVGGA